MKKVEKIFLNYRHLLPGLAPWLALSSSNYPYLKQISLVPKLFEPLRVYCIDSIYPKYSNTINPYHTCPKNWTDLFPHTCWSVEKPLNERQTVDAADCSVSVWTLRKNVPGHSISYKVACAPNEDSDQTAHPKYSNTINPYHTCPKNWTDLFPHTCWSVEKPLNERQTVDAADCSVSVWTLRKNEPGDSISYKVACAPNEDSYQPAHPRSLLRVFAGHSMCSQGSKASSGEQQPDQAARMHRLIWVFAEHTCNIVRNVSRFIFIYQLVYLFTTFMYFVKCAFVLVTVLMTQGYIYMYMYVYVHFFVFNQMMVKLLSCHCLMYYVMLVFALTLIGYSCAVNKILYIFYSFFLSLFFSLYCCFFFCCCFFFLLLLLLFFYLELFVIVCLSVCWCCYCMF